ncbi:hypothetical protein KIW84_011636 [Lathyrus oleraceus]|uniref:Uncharacterized protein n=1 Tax=Pisum sativum TaxID=3888 RepID=A0A9D5BFJ2_PEA|nr:hypothetical protein KIW84_011636 [Pisum sativum]
MASKKGRVSRGSSSRVAPTPNTLTFPDLKFLYEAHAEKYFKLVDYHIVRERAFTCDDLKIFGEVVGVLQQRNWVSFNNLIHEANNNIGLESYANATFGEVRTYTSYVRGTINMSTERTGVPAYPDDEMISTKAPLNASAIRRLQNMHQGEASQNDQEDNKMGNEEGFYQPQVQNQQQQM